ncbi:TAXI family TRAP transporter solute-binding subunit [Desertibacillus haloalkaliphilus]|uniref:TAXI family TRAP transporter solute-binding subunit n=1 Tax=Desertibacillus haloalkaliphilus TaxID=1328930 RepID=UPI001C26E58D|nr:TAXI family TRAP transporter solute-binding subunit [Desertibacillus haloalkaliphilus]MBU8908383.1 TAXI family TRAP transporter solute-binding subunit [Desertibacillus haloalkaliphilus]
MKKKLLFLLVSMFAFAIVLAACGTADDDAPADDADTGADEGTSEEATDADYLTDLQLGTGSTGGTYYPLGQEMANVMNDHVEYEGFNVSAVSSGASVDNIAQISRGEMQLGMSVHLPALDALNGEGEFDGIPVTNFGFMGHIYPEVMQVVTVEGTGITSIADLEGKRVAIGPPGSGTQAAARLILEAYGLEDGDYDAFEEGFGDAAGRLQDGQLDATFGLLGLPAGSVNELATQRDVVILPVEGEALGFIEENSGYEHLEIPADAYDFLEEPVSTITAYAVLVGSTDQISEELAYEITKALYENSENITHQQGEHMTIDNVLNGSNGLEFHPGAERYFEEIGLLE